MLEDPHACPPDLRCFSWRVLHAQCKRYRESIPVPGGVDRRRRWPGHGARLGRAGRQVYLPQDGAAPIRLEGQTSRVVALAFSRDGTLLASAAQRRAHHRLGRARRAWPATRSTRRGGSVAGLAWLADGPRAGRQLRRRPAARGRSA